MKTIITRLLKILALIIGVALFLSFMQNYVFAYIDQNGERVHGYYLEEENSLDVVFMGASDVNTAFAPGLAYEKFGFTSYVYAFDSNPGSLYKYQLKEILSTQDPQAVVIEINGLLYTSNQLETEARLHTFADNIPFTLNKLEAIFHQDVEDKISYVFPIINYHGNWIKGNKLLETFKWRTSQGSRPALWKGITACTLTRPVEASGWSELSPDVLIPEEQLIDLLEFCKSKNLSNIVFTRFPHRNQVRYTYQIGQIEQLLAEYGYALLNLEERMDEIGLDLNTDFYDDEHLNIYGQEKLTEYLGSYLANEVLDAPIKQSEANAQHWDECIGAYKLFNAYAKYLTEKGVERWVAEDPHELGYYYEWLNGPDFHAPSSQR